MKNIQPTAPTDDSHGPLTFGLELEFLVPSVKFEEPDPDPSDPRPVFHTPGKNIDISDETHKQFCIEAIRRTAGVDIRSDKQDNSVRPNSTRRKYDRWRYLSDGSVRFAIDNRSVFQAGKAYNWVGREITSPVLRADDPTYPIQIEAVCRALRNSRVHLNDKTSVHVHVGHGDDGFTLQTLKKFSSLLLVTEKHLLALQHPSRNDNKNCYLLGEGSKVASITPIPTRPTELAISYGIREFLPDITDAKLDNQTCLIWQLKRIDDLAELMDFVGPGWATRRGNVSFRKLFFLGNVKPNLNTLEFRHMAGSLDPDAIVKWVQVAVAMVDFARLSDASTFKNLMKEIIQREKTYTGYDFLNALKLPDVANYFREKVAGYNKGLTCDLAYYEGQETGKLFVPPL